MSRRLCISVTLLDPLFHGKGDGDKPEWPPSPMRLFQALLAGSRTGRRNGDWSEVKAEAFRWLERQSAPLIVAPEARPAPAYTLFVPNNDADRKPDRQDRLTSKVVRPHRIVCHEGKADERQTLHYLWSIGENEWPMAEQHAEALCREARRLMALGWGVDQAVGDGRILTDAEAAALPGERWRPWRNHRRGQMVSRVPTAGSLDNLERVHATFLSRIGSEKGKLRFDPPSKFSRFDSVVYLEAASLPRRHYAAFELPEGVAFRQESACEVAAMLRSLACRRAKADSHEFPGDAKVYVAGHIGRSTGPTPPRFSYLPLPTIGHPYADGMIRRLLIAEPYGGDGSHARWAQQRLRTQVLRDNDGNERGVLLDLWRTGSQVMVQRYIGDSRSWSTVTPVILPGFDDGKHAKAERLLLQAVQHAGLPVDAITDLTLRKAPFWPGSQHPNCYRRPDYLDWAKNRRFSAWHIHLLFCAPVSGPLSIGAGRHCGLGVFAVAKRSFVE